MSNLSPGEQHGTAHFPTRRDSSPARLATKAVLTNSSRNVLIIQERHVDGKTFWTLPGGGVKPEETAREALRREINEELQCTCTVGSAVGDCIYEHRNWSGESVYILFRARLHGNPQPARTERVLDCEWCHPSQLPESTLDSVETALTSMMCS